MALRVIAVFLLLGSAPGLAQWDRHTIDDSSSGADGARLADVNGDGRPDIAVGFEQGDITRALLHPAPDAASGPWVGITVGTTPDVEDAFFVDLDGDGSVDVVSASEGFTREVFVNWAPAGAQDYEDGSNWTSEALPAASNLTKWMFTAALQLDGQNGVDLVVGSKNPSGQIGWFQSPAAPRSVGDWQYHKMDDVGWTMSVLTEDMDADGDTDIVITDRKDSPRRGARWLENPGSSGNQTDPWTSHDIGGVGLEPMFMTLADLTGDGLTDAVVPIRSGRLLWYERGDAVQNVWIEHEITWPSDVGLAKGVEVGDMNGDGQLDIVMSFAEANNKSGVIWIEYENAVYDSEWTRHEISGTAGVKFDLLQLADLDLDGDLDVITTEEVTGLGVIWYENPSVTLVPAGNTAGLTIEPGPGDMLDLSWSPSCMAEDTNYVVYEGALRDFTSHTAVLCGTGSTTFALITPQPGDRYFLVASRNEGAEGSHGLRGDDEQRPPGSSQCLPQLVTSCP